MIIIAAVGNKYVGSFFPANFEKYVIGVGALDDCLSLRFDSTVWSSTDIVAPGEDIFSSFFHGELSGYQYHLWSGTSFASAILTGVVALAKTMCKHQKKDISSTELETILKDTADKTVYDKEKATTFIRQYEPTRKIFRDIGIVLECRYGAGCVQADAFIETLQKI